METIFDLRNGYIHFSPLTELTYTVCVAGKPVQARQEMAVEVETDVYVNRQKAGKLISSPHELDSLAVGYCLAEGKIRDGETIGTVRIQNGSAYVQTVPVTEVAKKDRPFRPVAAVQLCAYGTLLDGLSTAHHRSHGVHEGALVVGNTVLAYAEDIGRHNVLDRLRGLVVLHGIDVSQAVLVFSGRVPQSVITKVHSMGVKVLASRALPTSLGITLADSFGITVICGLRPDTFRLLTHGERIQW